MNLLFLLNECMCSRGPRSLWRTCFSHGSGLTVWETRTPVTHGYYWTRFTRTWFVTLSGEQI